MPIIDATLSNTVRQADEVVLHHAIQHLLPVVLPSPATDIEKLVFRPSWTDADQYSYMQGIDMLLEIKAQGRAALLKDIELPGERLKHLLGQIFPQYSIEVYLTVTIDRIGYITFTQLNRQLYHEKTDDQSLVEQLKASITETFDLPSDD